MFREYATAFKGARQLTWTRGLRAPYGIGETNDAELAEAEDREARTIGLLSTEAVAVIRSRQLALPVLEAAEAAGWEGVTAILARHGVAPRIASQIAAVRPA